MPVQHVLLIFFIDLPATLGHVGGAPPPKAYKFFNTG